MFYRTIKLMNNVSENMLVYIYTSIMEVAADIEAGRKEQAQNKIKNMAEVLMAIRKQEEMEREREGNPENMLKNI